MEQKDILELIKKQREFYKTNETKELNFRLKNLDKLYNILYSNRTQIFEALKKDLGKSFRESYLTELFLCLEEINYFKKNLKKLIKKKKVKNSLPTMLYKSYTINEPMGITYIISPFNYPVQLTIIPLIDSIAAGNTNILRLSAKSKHTSEILTKLLNDNFDEEFIKVIDVDYDLSDLVIKSGIDHVCFTGSTSVGKHIMEIASQNLVKVTLELGGKSPCILLDDANMEDACKKIVFGKFLNNGQTCIAVDHLYVNKDKLELVIPLLEKYIREFYSTNPLTDKGYGHLIDRKAYERIFNYFSDGQVVTGGKFNHQDYKFEPTIMKNIKYESKINTEEIFGPLLPIYTYKDEENLKKLLDKSLTYKPLAFYIFTKDNKKAEEYINTYSFGGGCINDTVMHITNNNLPFGGINQSGLNSYHGKYGFDNFSHIKSITKARNPIFDIKFTNKLRYAPYDDNIKDIDKLTNFLKKK